MKIKLTTIGLVCLAGILTIGLVGVADAESAIIYVPDHHTTIQAAVDAANSGDTIIVRDGTYTENVDVNKDHLTIRSENGAEKTISLCRVLDSDFMNSGNFEIYADNVTIEGFTFRLCGIILFSDNSTIRNNVFESGAALSLDYHVHDVFDSFEHHHFVENNTVNNKPLVYLDGVSSYTVTEAGQIILVRCEDITIKDLEFQVRTPIQLYKTKNSKITNNRFKGGGRTNVGIVLEFSSYNSIINNTIFDYSHVYGIFLKKSDNNLIRNNHIKTHLDEIFLSGSFLSGSSNNEIYLNDLKSIRMRTTGNILNSPELISYTYNGNTYTNYLGNYWEDYKGGDADGDGIGDTPYNTRETDGIDSGDKDNYPLMEPFENYGGGGGGGGYCPTNPANNHLYCLTPEDSNFNWLEAESYAVGLGGHLAAINNQEEQDWLVQTFGDDKLMWIGFTDSVEEGNWVWSNGDPVTYTKWEPTELEPNNTWSCGEDYAAMNWMCPGCWNDIGPCSPEWNSVGIGIIEFPGGIPPETCSDEVKNGDETDVDCGGSCSPCEDGEICQIDGDCSSDFCGEGICAYNLKLSIPFYAPYGQEAYQGTKLTYIVEIINQGNKEESVSLSAVSSDINLSPEDIEFSEKNPILVSPKSSKLIEFYLTVHKEVPQNTDFINRYNIAIIGTSEKLENFGEANIFARDIRISTQAENYGLFSAAFHFKNEENDQHVLDFEVPDYAKISNESIILNPNKEEEVNITFDPRETEDLEDGKTYVKIIKDKDKDKDNKTNLSVKFENYGIISTKFDMAEDAYKFSNTSAWEDKEKGKCYGMVKTAKLYFEKKLQLPNNATTTYNLEKKDAKSYINDYQKSPENYYYDILNKLFGNNKMKSETYERLKATIDPNDSEAIGELVIFMLRGKNIKPHVAIAYKIVEEKESGVFYILVYDPNWSFMDGPRAFSYITGVPSYKEGTKEIEFYELSYEQPGNEYTKFFVPQIQEILKKEFLTTSPWSHNILNIKCPVNITVTDQFGRRINNQGINEIPDAYVEIIDDKKIFYLPKDLTYSVEIEGYEDGEFTLTLISPLDENDAFITSFENVPVTPNTKADFTIQPGVTNYPMNIDYDGDGNIDETRNPDVGETLGGNPKLETQIAVTEMIYDGKDILANVTADVGDGLSPLLLSELKESSVDLEDYTPDGRLNPGQKKKLKMRFKFLETAGNEYQGKSINVKFKFLATQEEQ